jgi:Cys-tRNA(Pro)/Cys-tRNA(Cys) deacylase
MMGGVAYTVRERMPVTGQADAERELGLPADQMLKTMVFRARDTAILVALPARGRVHYGRLARAISVQRPVPAGPRLAHERRPTASPSLR